MLLKIKLSFFRSPPPPPLVLSSFFDFVVHCLFTPSHTLLRPPPPPSLPRCVYCPFKKMILSLFRFSLLCLPFLTCSSPFSLCLSGSLSLSLSLLELSRPLSTAKQRNEQGISDPKRKDQWPRRQKGQGHWRTPETVDVNARPECCPKGGHARHWEHVSRTERGGGGGGASDWVGGQSGRGHGYHVGATQSDRRTDKRVDSKEPRRHNSRLCLAASRSWPRRGLASVRLVSRWEHCVSLYKYTMEGGRGCPCVCI